MKVLVVLVMCVVGSSLGAVNMKQLNGIKRLIRNLNQGAYPTCDLVLFKEQVDFDTADENCRLFDLSMSEDGEEGNLATVNDVEKNAALKMLLELAYPIAEADTNKWGPDRWVWAGLRKVRNNVGRAVKGGYSPDDWEWADGSGPALEMWLKDQPDQKIDKKTTKGVKYYQNQMRINHKGRWDDTFVYKMHPYACDYQGKYILSPDKVTWTTAKQECEDAGLMLAKVRSPEEVEEMKLAATYFLGARDPESKLWANENWIWLGGHDLETEGEWYWVDGEKITWPAKGDFRDPNPDDAQFIGEDGQDVMAISKWGEFDDSFHTKKKRPFACQCPGT